MKKISATLLGALCLGICCFFSLRHFFSETGRRDSADSRAPADISLAPASFSRERAFLSGPHPPEGTTGAFSVGEISPKAQKLAGMGGDGDLRGCGGIFCVRDFLLKHDEDFLLNLSDELLGWTLPFGDYLHREKERILFSQADLRVKIALARTFLDRSLECETRERKSFFLERAALLISDVYAEYETENPKSLQAAFREKHGKAWGRINASTLAVERDRFRLHRQTLLHESRGVWRAAFLKCLEDTHGNDFDAQLRICVLAKTRGLIDLTKYRRPTLSDEAILQYEERTALKGKEK